MVAKGTEVELVVALFDKQLERYEKPMFFRSRVEALRAIQYMVRRMPGSHVAEYPEDYTAYIIGAWYAESGEFDRQEPIILVHCASLKEVSDESS